MKRKSAAQALQAAAAGAADFFISALGDESLSYSQRADAARTILDRALGKAGGAAPAEEIRVVLEGEVHRYAG